MTYSNEIIHADELPYDNSTSGLAATDVQAAIDELASGTVDDLLIADDDFDFLIADDDPEQFLQADG